ncbi:TPA: hypothetical protein NJ098_000420 [Vibrio parahaemolyticus]|nr:hypothetical protein [Vibrio parahaemolyticus]
MAKKIIFIHGRAQKPDKPSLEKLWYEAIEHGLQRDFGSTNSIKLFRDVDKHFVYYGDLSNILLEKPTEDPKSRFEALSTLKEYSAKSFNKVTYQRVSKAGFLAEALADTFSAVLGKLKLAEPLITAVAPDMVHYWNEETYYGSDLRDRLSKALKDAFDNGDQIMLVSHSLGTMISYDSLWKLSHYGEYRHQYGDKMKIDLFVTLGSPLGDENVKERLKGSSLKGEKKYPLNIHQWCNIAAEDDYISHDSKIKNDYKEMMKLGLIPGGMSDIQPVYNLCVRNGKSNPHSSIGYLINPKFTALIHEWLC